MPTINLVLETPVSSSVRVKQLSAMFDAPIPEKSRMEWQGELPIDDFHWNVGLIVGPSGCGKTSIVEKIWGAPKELTWGAAAVVDDFDKALSMARIAEVCRSVGFNTIPAWMRPYRILSNGEKFRVEVARRLLEGYADNQAAPVVMDEFTSVVDRQVAQIGAYAVQRYVRKLDKKFVAASCHYDIADWLQPDWLFEPATMHFARRSLRRRPELQAQVSRVAYSTWRIFSPYHYLTSELNKSARCFSLFIDGRIVSFAGVLYRPHAVVDDVYGCSRLVTLPDWQGLGCAMALVDIVGSAYKATGKRFHAYPAHPSLVRSFGNSDNWKMIKAPGTFSTFNSGKGKGRNVGKFGGRPNATFIYTGEPMDEAGARQLIGSTVPK